MTNELAPYLTPAVITIGGAVITWGMNTSLFKNAVKALTDKLSQEADGLAAEVMHSKNDIAKTLIRSAMSYIENHPSELGAFKSKADYVVSHVTSDPRFGSLGVPLSGVEAIIEEIFLEVFKSVDKVVQTPPAAV